MKNHALAATVALLVTGASSAAYANGTPAPLTSNFSSGVTAYSDTAAFSAAATNLVTDGFQGVATGSNGQDYVSYGSNASGGVGSYTDANGTIFSATNSGYNSNLTIEGTQYGVKPTGSYGAVGADFGSDVLSTNYNSLTISFAAPVTAFSIDYGSLGRAFAATSSADTFTFAISGLGSATEGAAGNINAGTFLQNGAGFFGVTSATAFSSITISGSGVDNTFYDNATYGAGPAAAVSAAPEPGAWELMLGGVGAMGLMLRRRRQPKLVRAAVA